MWNPTHILFGGLAVIGSNDNIINENDWIRNVLTATRIYAERSALRFGEYKYLEMFAKIL